MQLVCRYIVPLLAKAACTDFRKLPAQILVGELEAKLKAVQLEKSRLELENSQLESALVARMKLAAQADSHRMTAADKVLYRALCRPAIDLLCAAGHKNSARQKGSKKAVTRSSLCQGNLLQNVCGLL